MSKVLVVEDSKNISIMVKMCLNKHGYEVAALYDGLSALDFAFKNRPDLILLDVLIPKMDGYLVAQALKQDETMKSIPIIMMSARAQEDDINKALKIGVEDYLVKPFTPETLLDKVKKFIC